MRKTGVVLKFCLFFLMSFIVAGSAVFALGPVLHRGAHVPKKTPSKCLRTVAVVAQGLKTRMNGHASEVEAYLHRVFASRLQDLEPDRVLPATVSVLVDRMIQGDSDPLHINLSEAEQSQLSQELVDKSDEWVSKILSRDNFEMDIDTKVTGVGAKYGPMSVQKLHYKGKTYFFRPVFTEEQGMELFMNKGLDLPALSVNASARNFSVLHNFYSEFFGHLDSKHLPEARLARVNGIPGLLLNEVRGDFELDVDLQNADSDSLRFAQAFEFLVRNMDLRANKNVALREDGSLTVFDADIIFQYGVEGVSRAHTSVNDRKFGFNQMGSILPDRYSPGFLTAIKRVKEELRDRMGDVLSEREISGILLRADIILQDSIQRGVYR